VSLLRFWHERVERFRWQSFEVEWSAQRTGIRGFDRNGRYFRRIRRIFWHGNSSNA
jgi:hypothetical protein